MLFDLWEFYLNVMKTREAKASLWSQEDGAIFPTAAFQVEQSSDAVEKAAVFLKEDTKSKKKKIYVRELILGFAKINFSYFKSPRGSWGDSDKSNDAILDIDQLTLFPSHAMSEWSENATSDASINLIAAVFPSISKAPIRFQERIIYHVYESEGDIWRSLKSFYSSESLRQIYKIVGSLGKAKFGGRSRQKCR